MKTRTFIFGAASITGLVLTAASLTPANAGGSRGANGPDITCSRIGLTQSGSTNDIAYLGTVGGIRSYVMASTACNAPYPGNPAPDTTGDWNDSANPPGNPLIAQQLYRLSADGKRFEMLGFNWVKHSFCAVSEGTCGSCQSTGCDTLGIGCADTYTTGHNSSVGQVGPRWEVNPQGIGRGNVHDDVYASGGSAYNIGIRVLSSEILSDGSRYFGEIQYVNHDEQLARRFNNASHREMFFSGNTMTGAAGGQASVKWGEPAINAWKAANPAVTIVRFEDDPGAGRFNLGYLVTDNGDGTWTYEYALHNQNSHRAARGFSVPVPAGVTVEADNPLTAGINEGFRDVFYSNNDGWNGSANFDGTDWAQAIGAGSVSWLTADFATNPNANALRWGTMYNFRFTANTPPVADNATITMYRTGGQATVAVPIMRPDDIPAPVCPADLTGSKGPKADGVIDVFDLFVLLSNWNTNGAGADLADDVNVVDVFDLFVLLGEWGNCE